MLQPSLKICPPSLKDTRVCALTRNSQECWIPLDGHSRTVAGSLPLQSVCLYPCSSQSELHFASGKGSRGEIDDTHNIN